MATAGPEPATPAFFLQPLLMYIGNLQVLGLFAQLTDLAHVRFQLSFVTTNHTDSYYRPLPFVLIGHFGNRGVETGAETILQTAHNTALVLQGMGPRDHQFDGEQGDGKGWFRHGIDRRGASSSKQD